MIRRRNALNREQEEHERKMSEVNRRIHTLETDLNRLKRQQDQSMDRLMQAKAKQVKATQQVGRLDGEIARKAAEVAAAAAQVQDSVDKASSICGRIEDVEHPSYYNAQIHELNHRMTVEKAQFDHMDLCELELDVQEKAGKLNQKAIEFKNLSDNVHHVSAMLVKRKLKWAALRKEIATRTSLGFNKFMMKRDFAGKLKFDHTGQRLDVAVVRNKEGGTKLSVVNDMKQLSGGERSFTQVSLLMALGECIECPFRVMDEFDVFMDSINRTLTLKLLIETAKTEATKQFIFVTPNDLR
ncbi:hypothetical protein DYB25_005643 [Aphanomyces astaci]|nr:hypothetical protein DYB25_005643 [Aphanomyces astaci]RHY76733.1 hypothetical protein DYB34_003150 [Aphanomyces astaci]